MAYFLSIYRIRNLSVVARLACLVATVFTAAACSAAVPTHKVRMYMNMGVVEIELYANESPLNVANFLSYVDSGAYDNSFIHRTRASNPSQPFGFDLFAQGGSFKVPVNPILDQNPIVPGAAVNNEFNAANGLTNKKYSLSAARSSNPNSATSGWFINQSNNSASFDPGPYTVLGQVTVGTSIIDAIPFLPNSPGLNGSAFTSMPIYNGDLVIIHSAGRIPLVTGDYDLNGSVNGGDFNAWKVAYGSTNAAADGNADGKVDMLDYVLWRNTMGSGTGGLSGIVPEPGSWLLVLTATAFIAAFSRRRVARPCAIRPSF